MDFIEQKIQNLRNKLRYWEYMYYIENKSIVSNEIYDTTLKELHQLELEYPYLIKSNSPTQCIERMHHTSFLQVCHKTPMLSLNSITEKSELLLFHERVKNKLYDDTNSSIEYCCELKIDGVAVSLLYQQGKLIQAATRGDGKIGEDIIKNVYTIQSVPVYLKLNNNKRLPYLLEIRGEVFISKLCFEKLNKTMLIKGKKSFSNSRNAASGSLRQLNSNITALRPLSFYCYGISYHSGEEVLPDSHWERLQLCSSWGIVIDNHMQLVQGINEVYKYYDFIKRIRSSLDFNIDGVVIKVNSCLDQNKLGFGSKAPNWAVAYKFTAESKCTKLEKIIFKVGRTGLIIPIAYVNPIIIGNVVIKKVNIHNTNEINRLNLMIGDTVLIQRSGDVIPKILKVIMSERTDHTQSIKLPQFCPECGSVLKTWGYKFSMLRCLSQLTCLAQRKAALKHFVSRKGMNIQGVGEKIINQLVHKNVVSTPADFFYLNLEKLICLDRYGKKSAQRLLKSIDFSKKTTLSNFIYALGIPNVGEIVANNLASVYRNLEHLISTDLQSLQNLHCIGSVIATNIYDFFQNPNNLKIIDDLLDPNIGIQLIAIN